MSMHELRRNYDQGELLESHAHADAVVQFLRWFDEAKAGNTGPWFEPNAMTLATCSPMGQPTARIVLLKSADEQGFTFFTNYDSAKARDLNANPRASLVFHWAFMERQVRVNGTVTKTDRAETEGYFRGRPRGSQLGAWVSEQSTPVTDRATLERKLAELEQQFPGDVPAPPHWGGYRLRPDTIEFWQGRPNRLHDRLLYSRTPQGNWSITRLAP